MVYAKIAVIFVLAVMPFVMAIPYRPKVLVRFHEGMKRSENFRKFFTLIVLMVMIALQFIDFQASTQIAQMVQDGSASHTDTLMTMATHAALMTRPYATLLAAVIGLSFFSYKWADKVLTWLHENPKVFLVVGGVAMAIMMASARYIIVSEMILVILMAAQVYPSKRHPSDGN